MSILADYRVLADGSFSPVPNQDLSVLLPTNLVQGGGHQPVLSFRLDTGLPSDLMLRVRTANSLYPGFVTACTATFNSDIAYTIHEAIEINNLQGGVINTVRFERLGGTGVLTISDVVLWYKRNVTAANLSITP